MEELLNKLIEKGWKPRNKDYTDVVVYDWIVRFEWKIDCIETFRTLTSKSSWLWQFVCENGMIKTYENIEHESRRHSDKKHTPVWAFDNQSYYWLIESALTDEDKLEDFILSNIKLD